MKMSSPSRMQGCLLALFIVLLPYVARATTATVHVGANFGLTFTPDPVVIQPGDTVEWVWDASGHSVTSGTPPTPDGTFDTGLQSVGFIFSHTFPTAGGVPYFCTRHGAMMTGTVNVVVATPTPIPTTTPTATPTLTPTPTPALVSISGSVTYCSNPIGANPVAGATMTLTGGAVGTTLTDGSGAYTFTGLQAGLNYTVTLTKANRVPGSAGINTVDVLAVQKHFLNIPPALTACHLAAGDVAPPFNGLPNTVDVIAIQKFFLNNPGTANVGQYQFAPASRSYTPLSSDQTAEDFAALIFGDVIATFADRAAGDPSDDAAEVPASEATADDPDDMDRIREGQ